MKRHGFTLIELLIVVAVIAILAAIALPNLLEAQVRAKVARDKSDMRTVATGIEAYTVDYRHPPYDGEPMTPHYGWMNALEELTTPVSYLSSVPADVFQDPTLKLWQWIQPGQTNYLDPPDDTIHTYEYSTARWNQVGTNPFWKDLWVQNLGNTTWRLSSCGPDHKSALRNGIIGIAIRYDPTNGTVSVGEIYRTQGLYE